MDFSLNDIYLTAEVKFSQARTLMLSENTVEDKPRQI